MLIIAAGYLDSSRQANYNTINCYSNRTQQEQSVGCKSCKITAVVVCASREILIRMHDVAGKVLHTSLPKIRTIASAKLIFLI